MLLNFDDRIIKCFLPKASSQASSLGRSTLSGRYKEAHNQLQPSGVFTEIAISTSFRDIAKRQYRDNGLNHEREENQTDVGVVGRGEGPAVWNMTNFFSILVTCSASRRVFLAAVGDRPRALYSRR